MPSWLPLVLPIAVMALPLADLGLAYVRRTWRGDWWFVADKRHLHHRLLQAGHSQRSAVLVMYLWTAVISFGAIALGLLSLPWRVLVPVLGVVLATLVTLRPLRGRVAGSGTG
jgi:UDP-GlcNAc:undecaprenyl-phosphate GlcNAc-1-phosphate transferase